MFLYDYVSDCSIRIVSYVKSFVQQIFVQVQHMKNFLKVSYGI